MMKTRDHRIFAGIAALHFTLTLAFIARVPLKHAPDEGPHWGYVQHLAEKHSLPVFGAEGVTYEAHQPPLYYLLCVPAYLATSGISANATVVACRVVSALAGLVSLVFIWLGAREVFRGDSIRPLLTAAFCAVLPMNLYVNAAASNDALAGMMAGATLWWLLRCCGRGFDERSALIAGALAGVAMLCKMNAMFLVPVAALATFVWSRRNADELPRTVRLSSLSVLSALVISAPWLLRNSWLYGDPLAWRVFNEFFRTKSPSPQDMMQAFGLSWLEYMGKVASLTWATFWGIGGEVNSAIRRMGLFGASSDLPFLAAMFLSCVSGALIGFSIPHIIQTLAWLWFPNYTIRKWARFYGRRVRAAGTRDVVIEEEMVSPEVEALFEQHDPDLAKRKRERQQTLELRRSWRVESFVLFVSAVLVLAMFVQFNTHYFQAQARYLHMALLPLAAFWSSGYNEVQRKVVWGGWIWWLLPLLFLLVIALLDLTIWQPILLPGGGVMTGPRLW